MRKTILDKYPVITKSELTRILNEMIKKNTYLSEGMSKDLYRLVDSYNTKELENVQISIGEEVNKFDGVPDTKEDEEPKKTTRKKKSNKESEVKEEVSEKPKRKRATKKKVEA